MNSNRKLAGRRTLLALAIGCCMQVAIGQSLDTQRQYDLPAGRLGDALNTLSEQSGALTSGPSTRMGTAPPSNWPRAAS